MLYSSSSYLWRSFSISALSFTRIMSVCSPMDCFSAVCFLRSEMTLKSSNLCLISIFNLYLSWNICIFSAFRNYNSFLSTLLLGANAGYDCFGWALLSCRSCSSCWMAIYSYMTVWSFKLIVILALCELYFDNVLSLLLSTYSIYNLGVPLGLFFVDWLKLNFEISASPTIAYLSTFLLDFIAFTYTSLSSWNWLVSVFSISKVNLFYIEVFLDSTSLPEGFC